MAAEILRLQGLWGDHLTGLCDALAVLEGVRHQGEIPRLREIAEHVGGDDRVKEAVYLLRVLGRPRTPRATDAAPDAADAAPDADDAEPGGQP
jgi:hypothetical protein